MQLASRLLLAKHNTKCPKEAFRIKSQACIADIVQFNFLSFPGLERSFVAPRCLPKPRDASWNAAEKCRIVAKVLQLIVGDRTRTDDGYLAKEDIQELRQLIDRCLAEAVEEPIIDIR